MSGAQGPRGRREWILDTLLWIGLTAPIAYNQAVRSEWAWLLGVILAMAVAVGCSRRVPLISFAIVAIGGLVDGNFSFSIPVMGYLVGRRTARTVPAVLVFVLTAVVGTLFNVLIADSVPSRWFVTAFILLVCGVFPWLIGRYRAQHAELVTAGWDRAARLERERQMVAEQARLRERARIAEDIHDSLGHELSLLALRAGALETAPDLPDSHRAAAGSVRAGVADATDRLRDAIGLLREVGRAAPLDPATDSTDDLVARARDSGVAVTLDRSGSADGVPHLVDRAVHRIVQESLTNATRHAPGARVVVTLEHAGDATTISVVNEPPPAGPLPGARPADHVGVGLVGLRERVRVAGGTLRAERQEDGGFGVEAWIPHRAPAAADEEVAVTAELQQVQRLLRRRLAVAIAAPLAVMVVAAAGYYPFVALNSTLSGRDFARMAIGATRAELAGVLPARQTSDRPIDGFAAVPSGAVCEFYTDGNFPLARATYRLCFAGGRLVEKEAR